MIRKELKLSCVFTIVLLVALGCTSVNYIGNSFDPTTDIKIYYSKAEIQREYTVIGHALGLGLGASCDLVQAKLLKEAKLKGADAVLITMPGKSQVLITAGFSLQENRIYTSFLKYK